MTETKQNKMINVDNSIYNDFGSVCRKMKIKIGDRLDKLMKEDIRKYNEVHENQE